jgi:uncharacterized membrane protein YfcA
MISDASWWVYPFLFAAAFLGGWVDSIAGGGGMITIPALLSVGIPPHMVLGTNKLQASFGSFTASAHYVRQGVVPLGDARTGILWTLCGSAAGTIAVQRIHPGVLNIIIPFLLLGIALFVLLMPTMGLRATRPRVGRTLFYIMMGLSLGFYDGFFGPGVGSFWAIAFILGLGFDFVRATGYTKVMNFTSNVTSLVVFALGGNVLLATGLIMAIGQTAGARLGAGMVLTRGTEFIRPVFITIVLLTTAKLLWDRLG